MMIEMKKVFLFCLIFLIGFSITPVLAQGSHIEFLDETFEREMVLLNVRVSNLENETVYYFDWTNNDNDTHKFVFIPDNGTQDMKIDISLTEKTISFTLELYKFDTNELIDTKSFIWVGDPPKKGFKIPIISDIDLNDIIPFIPWIIGGLILWLIFSFLFRRGR